MIRFILKSAAAFAISVATACAFASIAHADSALEYRVKAAFLYNFAKFVDWPRAVFPSDESPVVFCLVGPDPFGNSLDGTVGGRQAGGRDIVVKREVNPEQLSECHLVFAASDQANAVARILQRGVRSGLLTVGEGADFIESGGVISLVVDEGKVRFDVSTEAAEAADLKVSSQLLKLARTVKR
jgi:hypothetical protein